MSSTKSLSARDFSGLKGINVADGSAGTDVASTNQVSVAQSFAISRANHTGSQLSATISDLAATVLAYRLDQFAQPTNPVAFNNQRASSLADPTAAQDAATKNYVDAQISGLSSGMDLKGTVRAVSTANVNLAAPGTTIDGLTAANGDIFLLTAQSTASQNGPYVFNGAAAAMTRATNWNTSAEAVLGSFWIVEQGSKDNQFAIMTNDTAVTLDTTSITFAFIVPGGSASPLGYTTTCPAVSAGAAWTVTHGLGTKWIIAQVARVASPYDIVDARIERTSTTVVTVQPDVALNSGDYEIMVYKVA